MTALRHCSLAPKAVTCLSQLYINNTVTVAIFKHVFPTKILNAFFCLILGVRAAHRTFLYFTTTTIHVPYDLYKSHSFFLCNMHTNNIHNSPQLRTHLVITTYHIVPQCITSITATYPAHPNLHFTTLTRGDLYKSRISWLCHPS